MSHSRELALIEKKESAQTILELDERRDAFGNRIRLLWNSEDDSVHLTIDGFDIEVPKDKAAESRDHPYPLIYARYGEAILNNFTVAA